MTYTNMLKQVVTALQSRIHEQDINDLVAQIEDCIANPEKEKIVIHMNGGLIQDIISEVPIECLKIEEPGDSDSEELLEMYPEKGGAPYQEGAHEVYAGILEAECNPDDLQNVFTRFATALVKKEQEHPDSGMSPS